MNHGISMACSNPPLSIYQYLKYLTIVAIHGATLSKWIFLLRMEIPFQTYSELVQIALNSVCITEQPHDLDLWPMTLIAINYICFLVIFRATYNALNMFRRVSIKHCTKLCMQNRAKRKRKLFVGNLIIFNLILNLIVIFRTTHNASNLFRRITIKYCAQLR